MRSLNTQAIILGHKNFGEKHKLVFLYTETHGKIKAIAKGARKITSRFTGHLETLNFCEIGLYFGPKNIILTEVTTIKSFHHIRNDLGRMQSALQISEITNRIIFESQNIENLLALLQLSMENLIHAPRPELISHSYIVKLLDRLGLLPDFKLLKSTKMSDKYRKYFHFLRTQDFQEIQKINLSLQEAEESKKILEQILKHQLQENFSVL